MIAQPEGEDPHVSFDAMTWVMAKWLKGQAQAVAENQLLQAAVITSSLGATANNETNRRLLAKIARNLAS